MLKTRRIFPTILIVIAFVLLLLWVFSVLQFATLRVGCSRVVLGQGGIALWSNRHDCNGVSAGFLQPLELRWLPAYKGQSRNRNVSRLFIPLWTLAIPSAVALYVLERKKRSSVIVHSKSRNGIPISAWILATLAIATAATCAIGHVRSFLDPFPMGIVVKRYFFGPNLELGVYRQTLLIGYKQRPEYGWATTETCGPRMLGFSICSRVRTHLLEHPNNVAIGSGPNGFLIHVPLLFIGFLLALYPGGTFLRNFRQRRRILLGFCGPCGYNLSGCVSDLCPECGSPIPSNTREEP